MTSRSSPAVRPCERHGKLTDSTTQTRVQTNTTLTFAHLNDGTTHDATIDYFPTTHPSLNHDTTHTAAVDAR